MFARKPAKVKKRLVWRMSAANPAGEFVSPSKRQAARASPAEVHERGFRVSSMELSTGSDVIETEMNTLPGELVDEFFKVGR
jgi:hypothetical protein